MYVKTFQNRLKKIQKIEDDAVEVRFQTRSGTKKKIVTSHKNWVK